MTKTTRLKALEKSAGISDTPEQEHDFRQVIHGPRPGEENNFIEYFIDGNLVTEAQYSRAFTLQTKGKPIEIEVHLAGDSSA